MEIFNSSFKNVGYAYSPPFLQTPLDYPLFSYTAGALINVTKSYFKNDAFISLSSGYVAIGEVLQVDIVDCQFIGPEVKYKGFEYKGLCVYIVNLVNFQNNIISNLTCSNSLVVGPNLGSVIFSGEYAFKYEMNKKFLTISRNYFQSCSCPVGGAMVILNYHKTILEGNIFINNN